MERVAARTDPRVAPGTTRPGDGLARFERRCLDAVVAPGDIVLLRGRLRNFRLALPENPAQDQANDSFCDGNHGVSYGNGGSGVSRHASSPAICHATPRRERVLRYKGVRRNRRLFVTTVTELSAMASAANMGCSSLNIIGRKVSE